MLEKLLLSEQPERFRKSQAFIRAQGLCAEAVAELVSSAVVQALLASTQELQPGESADCPTSDESNMLKRSQSEALLTQRSCGAICPVQILLIWGHFFCWLSFKNIIIIIIIKVFKSAAY